MRKKILYSTVAALMIFPSMLMAEESEDQKIKTLDEVVVTATRASKDIKKVPANVTVISAEEIADSGASNIIEILESQANIHIRTFSGNPSQAQIDLRGFGENGFGRTLVLLDGRKLNRPDMQSITWTQFPLDHIERIEVVRSSASVLYGDAAVSGVIHIITKKGTVDPSFTASIQAGEDGFHDERAGVIGSSDRFTYSVSVSNQQTDGWRERTGYDSYGGGLQLGYDISDSLGVSGGISYNRTDFEMPNALTSAEIAQDPTQSGFTSDEAENEFYNYNLLLEGSFGNWGDPSINLVYGTSENISTRFSWWSFGVYDIESIGIQPKYVLETDHGRFRNKLITGFDLYYETLIVDLYAEAARLNRNRTTEIDKDTVGWYIHDEISIDDTIILSGGARIERSETHGRLNDFVTPANNFDKEKDHDGEVFDLSATWLPKDNLKFYTRFSTVYRYPFVDEQANYSGWGMDDLNTDLEAEEGKSFEAGIEINPAEDFIFGLTLFNIDMEDEISLNPVTWVNDNMDDTRHRGLEMSLDYGVDGVFDLSVNYTHQETTFEAGPNVGNDVPLVPHNLLSASLDLTLPYDIHLIPYLQYIDNSYLSGDTNNNTEKLDEYTVVDLLLRYKTRIRNIQLTAFLKVTNLFDEEYSTWGLDNMEWFFPNQFYPAPGRKFYGGISGTF